ncbi:unnamed protein product [Symbiodinium necroappetens]|uniref:Uncharacterized protein n=1 Tax=Symbiodinium necroappetens TaxID=1628268 RepID=A0A812WB70_9DINO|nr:unnamed protein product [Symbiodinium necroappetens]
MTLDIQVLRDSLRKKPFRSRELSLLQMIQQFEAIQLQKLELLEATKRLKEAFKLTIGFCQVEITALDTVAAVIDQLAGEVGDDSGSLAITKEATLVALGINASSQLDFSLAGFYVFPEIFLGVRVSGLWACGRFYRQIFLHRALGFSVYGVFPGRVPFFFLKVWPKWVCKRFG